MGIWLHPIISMQATKKVVLFYCQKKFCLKEVTTKYPIYKISFGVKANKKIIQNFMLHKF